MNYNLDESIRWCIHKADLALKNSAQRILNPYDITIEQWGILSRLYEEEGCNQKELAEKNLKDQAALTRILDLLEKKQWVYRARSEHDRREFLLFITDAGRELCQTVIPALLQNAAEMTACLSQHELDQLKKSLAKLAAAGMK